MKKKIMVTPLKFTFYLLVLLLLVDCANSCGKSLDKHLQNKIIGGNDIGYYKYPWFGLLKINDNLRCGCTLISDQFAITAATCFREYIPVKSDGNSGVFTVTLGIYNRCEDSEATRNSFYVQRVYIHQDFQKGKVANNLALLKFYTTTNFQPVCLPSKPVPADQRPSEGIITGLGIIDRSPQGRTCTVHEGRVLIYDNETCGGSLKRFGEDPSVLNTTFCAGGVGETKPYGCGIDLGGPLTVTDDNGTWYLLGVITFKKCADNNNITLYQDVSQFLDWIHTTIAGTTTTASPITTTKPPDNDYDEDLYDEKGVETFDKIETSSQSPQSSVAVVVNGPQTRRHGRYKHLYKKHGTHGDKTHEHKNHEHKNHEHKNHEHKNHEHKNHEHKNHEDNDHEHKNHEHNAHEHKSHEHDTYEHKNHKHQTHEHKNNHKRTEHWINSLE